VGVGVPRDGLAEGTLGGKEKHCSKRKRESVLSDKQMLDNTGEAEFIVAGPWNLLLEKRIAISSF